jgi:ribonucleoside-diphosphate reductase alpha chain
VTGCKEVWRQLIRHRRRRSLGFGPNRVRSLPDGVAQVLAEYLAAPAEQVPLKFGDLCPECGQAAVVNEEGCRKCYACGYSEC